MPGNCRPTPSGSIARPSSASTWRTTTPVRRVGGGQAITQAQVAAWAAHARTRLPGLPLGVRVTPDWVAAYPPLALLLDYAWAQYYTKKGDARTYYDKSAAAAQKLGWSL